MQQLDRCVKVRSKAGVQLFPKAIIFILNTTPLFVRTNECNIVNVFREHSYSHLYDLLYCMSPLCCNPIFECSIWKSSEHFYFQM